MLTGPSREVRRLDSTDSLIDCASTPSNFVQLREHPTDPSTSVRLIDHTEMTRAGEVLCTTSGFHDLDFILEEESHFVGRARRSMYSAGFLRIAPGTGGWASLASI